MVDGASQPTAPKGNLSRIPDGAGRAQTAPGEVRHGVGGGH